MADGKVSVNYSQFLGYGKDMKVVPEEAKIIQSIYRLYLEGLSEYAIAKKLMEEGIPSPAGKQKWYRTTVRSILQNEKYRGSALLQKTFTEDFLTKKHKKNEGELPQYWIEKSHEAIIPPEIFDKVQAERKRRSGQKHYSGVSIFSNKVKCGECGNWYGSKVWHSTDKYRRVIWQCNHKFKNKECRCGTPHLTEDELKEAFVKALNKFIGSRDEVIANARLARQVVCDTATLEKEQSELENEIHLLEAAAESLVGKNARVAMDQKEFQKEYADLEKRYKAVEKRRTEVVGEIEGKKQRGDELDSVIRLLEEADGPVTEFSERQWGEFADHITVYSYKDIRVTMRDGMEIWA